MAEGARRLHAYRAALVAVVVVPLVGFVAAVATSWALGVLRPVDLALLVGLYLFTGLGITAGYHRLFSHRSFETRLPVRRLLAVAGSMACQGPLISWVAEHRRHHQLSDRDGDPHSPHHHGEGFGGLLRGLWHAHLGWLFADRGDQRRRYAPDLMAEPAVATVDRNFLVWVGLGLLLPAAAGWAVEPGWRGALLGLLWGGLARIFLVQHVTWSVNSICHVFGSRPFRVGDRSTNNALCALLSLGEGWHNNHHAFPASARHGLSWWQLDLTWAFILALRAVGLAWVVRLPSAHELASRAPETGRAAAGAG